jgi:hypothetical protein
MKFTEMGVVIVVVIVNNMEDLEADLTLEKYLDDYQQAESNTCPMF